MQSGTLREEFEFFPRLPIGTVTFQACVTAPGRGYALPSMHPRDISDLGNQEMSVNAVVGKRGRVTIPKRLRERVGIRRGTVLEFREEADKLIAEKAEAAGPLDRWYGSLGQERRTDDILRALRGEP